MAISIHPDVMLAFEATMQDKSSPVPMLSSRIAF